MGFLDWMKKGDSAADAEQEQTDSPRWDAVLSGMRVEVTDLDGRMLFNAGLIDPNPNGTARLCQYSGLSAPKPRIPIRVKIRGYNIQTDTAVYLEGLIAPRPKDIWRVDELTLLRVGKDRASYRLTVDLDAVVIGFGGPNAGQKPCKLVNISVDGACIVSPVPYQAQDKLLLKVQMPEEPEISKMMCQVLRVNEKENGTFEYGCKFVGIREAAKARISQHIFAAQLKNKR